MREYASESSVLLKQKIISISNNFIIWLFYSYILIKQFLFIMNEYYL